MNQKHLWQLLLIVFVLAWSVFELTPPKGRDLLQDFQQKARNRDAAFSNIVQRAKDLQATNTAGAYASLKTAIGTNEVTQYFPNINVKGEKDPSTFVLNRLQRDAAGQIKLGLDLQGGTSILVGMDTSNLGTNVDRGTVLANAIEVLRKRVDRLGVAEPLLQPAGEDRILIQLPGLTQAAMDDAISTLERAAFLEFRMVHPESEALLSQGIVEPGYEVLRKVEKGTGGVKEVRSYLVKKGAEQGLNGTHIKRAFFTRDQLTNKPEISFEMNAEGTELFAKITTEWQPKGNKKYLLAIVLDGELESAPQINGPITGGRGVIQGDFEPKEAVELANVLENPLEAPIKILDQRTVDPSLGQDSINSGIKSAIFGTIAVALFMLVYYMLAGAVANVALLTNIVILLGVMCSIDTTLTLPGIAGIVLTVGMAVDANVLIFERIREESAKGKSLKGALSAGYDRAFGTIFDSHVTTLISSIILIYMGTGSIKGFGVALSIGVAASLFTALVVTRLIFDFLLAKGVLTSIKMLHIIRDPKLDFMKWAKPAFTASWLLILVGMGYGIFGRGQHALGVDFLGGDDLTLRFVEKIDTEKLREAITKAGFTEPLIQYQQPLGGGPELLRITSGYDTGDKVAGLLQQEFSSAKFEKAALDKVGPTIGKEIQQTAIIAVLLSLLGILVYVALRYEFSFAVAAVVAVLHDVMMTIGICCLSGMEFNAPSVAAILTIIGFSINDTIVIFDRIREDLKLGVRGSFKDVINQALNQTLSRTIITSGTVLLATLALYIFGGGAINDFAFTFLAGILTGTYSSIYIASALVLWWHKGHRPNLGSGVTVESAASVREPVASRV
jgi:SecD/SecF fusion protein